MEPFSRVDIFDTKGIEYIMVIGYLLVLIIFWNVARNPRRVVKQIQEAISTLSASILRIPQGIFFSRHHTWTHLGVSGNAKVGLDDFIQHVIGKVKLSPLKKPGEEIQKGELLTEIRQDGKHLRVYSPISGKITQTNGVLDEDPDVINRDPYDKGWIYQIKPTKWVKETKSYLLAEEAADWSAKELIRFKDFLAGGPMRKYATEPSMILLQDGGEIRENVLSDLPKEVWEDFQQEFLNTGHPEE
jgi:glycine cleavage system H protein